MNRNPTKSGIISAQKGSQHNSPHFNSITCYTNWWEWSQNFRNRNANCDARWFNQFCVRGWKSRVGWSSEMSTGNSSKSIYCQDDDNAHTRPFPSCGSCRSFATLWQHRYRLSWGCLWRKSLLWQFLRSFINFPDEASSVCWCARVAPFPPTSLSLFFR